MNGKIYKLMILPVMLMIIAIHSLGASFICLQDLETIDSVLSEEMTNYDMMELRRLELKLDSKRRFHLEAFNHIVRLQALINALEKKCFDDAKLLTDNFSTTGFVGQEKIRSLSILKAIEIYKIAKGEADIIDSRYVLINIIRRFYIQDNVTRYLILAKFFEALAEKFNAELYFLFMNRFFTHSDKSFEKFLSLVIEKGDFRSFHTILFPKLLSNMSLYRIRDSEMEDRYPSLSLLIKCLKEDREDMVWLVATQPEVIEAMSSSPGFLESNFGDRLFEIVPELYAVSWRYCFFDKKVETCKLMTILERKRPYDENSQIAYLTSEHSIKKIDDYILCAIRDCCFPRLIAAIKTRKLGARHLHLIHGHHPRFKCLYNMIDEYLGTVDFDRLSYRGNGPLIQYIINLQNHVSRSVRRKMMRIFTFVSYLGNMKALVLMDRVIEMHEKEVMKLVERDVKIFKNNLNFCALALKSGDNEIAKQSLTILNRKLKGEERFMALLEFVRIQMIDDRNLATTFLNQIDDLKKVEAVKQAVQSCDIPLAMFLIKNLDFKHSKSQPFDLLPMRREYFGFGNSIKYLNYF